MGLAAALLPVASTHLAKISNIGSTRKTHRATGEAEGEKRDIENIASRSSKFSGKEVPIIRTSALALEFHNGA